MPERTLTVLMFRDEAGLNHAAVPVAQAVIGRRSFALAVSDRPGLLVLEERDGNFVPVRDRKLATLVGDAIRATTAEEAEPALVFEAAGPGGRRARFTGTRAVAKGGEPYIVATDPATGQSHVFHARRGPGGGPLLVGDEGAARKIREIALAGERAPARLAVLTFPTGERRELELVKELRLTGVTYAIGVDRAEGARAYLLRVGPGSALTPVTDAAEVDRVRLAIADRRSSPAEGR